MATTGGPRRAVTTTATSADIVTDERVEGAVAAELRAIFDRSWDRYSEIPTTTRGAELADARWEIVRRASDVRRLWPMLRERARTTRRPWLWQMLSVLDWTSADVRNRLRDPGLGWTPEAKRERARRERLRKARNLRLLAASRALDSVVDGDALLRDEEISLTAAFNEPPQHVRSTAARLSVAAETHRELRAASRALGRVLDDMDAWAPPLVRDYTGYLAEYTPCLPVLAAHVRFTAELLRVAVHEHDLRARALQAIPGPERAVDHVRASVVRVLIEVLGLTDRPDRQARLAEFVADENDALPRRDRPCPHFAADDCSESIRQIMSRTPL